ncbi:MAG TPA: signal peptidase I [Polyangiaceae bacterium]|nr:signal peptidase I [Polyangiaceae bacterium]
MPAIDPSRRLANGAASVFLEFVAPGLLAFAAIHHLLPTELAKDDFFGATAVRFAVENPLLVGVVLFFSFAWVIRHWTAPLRRPDVVLPASNGGGRSSARRALIALAATVLAAGAALLFRQVGFEARRVVGSSMLPTLEPGDCVATSKSAYALSIPFTSRRLTTGRLRRGDLIVFDRDSTQGVEHLVKRVIGLPGDRVRIRAGHPLINDWEIPSCDAGTYFRPEPHGGVEGRLLVEFLEDRAYLTVYTPLTTPFADEFVVAEGEVFVLGDNRNGSVDSRSWNQGHGAGVPLADVRGEASRFLLGAHRDESVDWSRFLRGFGTALHLEGMDLDALHAQIARCLRQAPRATTPPAPRAGVIARSP